MTKPRRNTDTNTAASNVPDLQTFGGDQFKLISKASSEVEGWMKSTKAMQCGCSGCLVQVTTQQRNPDGSYAIAEALTCVQHGHVHEINDDSGAVISRYIGV